jgi:creatinine amidohydrolase
MPSVPRRFWQDMTTTEFGDASAQRWIAVLPVGAIEQHGPHLPLCVDACINQGILERTLELLPERLPVTLPPPMPVGKSNEHIAFAGTLTLSAETLIRLWTELGEAVARAGVRKLVLFNSHRGQPPVMDIVARDLRVRLGLLVVAYSWYAAGVPPGLLPDHEVRYGIHAGAIETSIMLHLRPDLVLIERTAEFTPLMAEMAAQYRLLSPTGPGRLAWQAQELHPPEHAAMPPMPMPSAAAALSSTPRRSSWPRSRRSTAIRSPISGTVRRTPEDGRPVAAAMAPAGAPAAVRYEPIGRAARQIRLSSTIPTRLTMRARSARIRPPP